MPKPARKGSEARDPFEGVEDEVSTPEAIFAPSAKPVAVTPAPQSSTVPGEPRQAKPRPKPKPTSGGFEVPAIDVRGTAKRRQASFEWDDGAYEAVQEWLAAHPGHTLTSLLYCGLASLGLDIDDDLLRPRRTANGFGARSRRKNQ